MNFASSTRVAEHRKRWKEIFVVICGAQTTLQGYGIEQNRIPGYEQMTRSNDIAYITCISHWTTSIYQLLHVLSITLMCVMLLT